MYLYIKVKAADPFLLYIGHCHFFGIISNRSEMIFPFCVHVCELVLLIFDILMFFSLISYLADSRSFTL